MKFGVSTYSFGHYLAPDQLGMYGAIDKAAEMGFDCIEFSTARWEIPSDEEVAKIGEYAAKAGLTVPAFCVNSDLLNGCEGNLDAEVERICRMVDRAEMLGAAMLRHDATAGFKDRKYARGYADALPRLIEGSTRVTEYAEAKGIKTMTENHGLFSQDADRVEALVNGVAHPNFGVLLDLGNFMCADEDPTLSVGKLAPYAFHVHAKDFLVKSGVEQYPGDGWFFSRGGNYLRGTVIGHGEAKVVQSLKILKRLGYDSTISVEFEGLEDNLFGIEQGLAYLKRIWDTI